MDTSSKEGFFRLEPCLSPIYSPFKTLDSVTGRSIICSLWNKEGKKQIPDVTKVDLFFS